MAYLLDTVAVIRWWTEADKLGDRTREVLEADNQAIFLSPVSVWEISNKNRIGKLPQVVDFESVYPDLLRRSDFIILPIGDRHAMRAGYLPGEHRDPFDRLLAGQALEEDLVVLTNDFAFTAFGCKVLW